MKKYLSAAMVVLTLTLTQKSCIAQENDWELPVKNDLICFEYSKTFKNAKKELCYYYTSSALQSDLTTKVNAELSGKGGKLLSNTNYKMFFLLRGADWGTGGVTEQSIKKHMNPCEANKDDTLEGSITIMIQKRDLIIRGTKHAFNTVKCRFRVILIGTNKYTLRFRGFSVGGVQANYVKGSVQSTEEYLEDIYNDFLNDKHKSKSDKEFYKDLKEMINVFQTLLGEQIERAIKVSEQD